MNNKILNKELLCAIALLVILFITGFIGDLGTQYVATFNNWEIGKKASLFNPFWKKNGKFKSAVMCGVITLLWGSIFLLYAALVFHHLRLNIQSWSFVLFSMAISFVLGTFLDVAIDRGKWIPELNLWYKTMGCTLASTWSGGLTFAFVAFFASTFLVLI